MKQIMTGVIVLASLSLLGACIKQELDSQKANAQTSPAVEIVQPVTPLPEVAAEAEQKPVAKKPSKPSKPKKPEPIHMGWVERAYLPALGVTSRAKLDSGAKTSSINADIIKTFKRDKKEYVLFRIVLDEEDGTAETLEREIVRWVRIKKKGDGFIRRPVIMMTFCLGEHKINGEVNLASRGNFIYPILVGRSMLQDRIVIDAGRRYTTKPGCKE